MAGQTVAVIGAGIGGLTAGALLAKRGYDVTVYEQAAIILNFTCFSGQYISGQSYTTVRVDYCKKNYIY